MCAQIACEVIRLLLQYCFGVDDLLYHNCRRSPLNNQLVQNVQRAAYIESLTLQKVTLSCNHHVTTNLIRYGAEKAGEI